MIKPCNFNLKLFFIRYYIHIIILINIFCISCEIDGLKSGNRLFEKGNYEGAIEKYSNTIIADPNNYKIYFNRSIAWKKLNRMDKALDDLDKVIQLKPELPFPYLDRGIILAGQGSTRLAIENFNKAIELKPDYIQAYHNRGYLKEEAGDYDSAVQDYSRSLDINPYYFPSLIARARIYQTKENFELSILDLNQAIDINKDSPDAYLARGKAHYTLNNFELAIKDFDNALKFNSKNDEVYLYKGNIFYQKCDINNVILNYSLAIDLPPNDSNEYNELAWILATIPDEKYRDGTKAIKLALQSSEIDFNYKNLDTLSAAYAESGRFEDAIETQIKAINLCNLENKCEILPQLLNRLNYYKKNNPWREECLPR